jgi:TPP-dependent pyruvate/acetoin dehydrogenase alpha subunit
MSSPDAPDSKNLQIQLYRGMLRIRLVEETLAELYKEQEMRTPTHFSIGQEAVAVGVCAALTQQDVVYSGHRSHANFLASGGSLDGLVNELYGKEAGSAGGRGGSVHLTQRDSGFIASSAILGQTIATAVGSALSLSMDSLPNVAVSFFGDGSADEGIFPESLNFASIYKLPVIFVCENNLYSTHTSAELRRPKDSLITERAETFGVRAVRVDGNNALAVYEAASEARELCVTGEGPVLIEGLTYRWREHVGPYEDYELGYRSQEEVDSWKQRDPVRTLGDSLTATGACSRQQLDDWATGIEEEIAHAVEQAKSNPFPASSSLFDDVY